MREGRVFDDPAPLMSAQRALGPAPVMVPPGTHFFDALGTTISLRTTDFWRLEAEHPGVFSLTEPGAPLGATAPVISFHRPLGLSDPSLVGTSLPGNSPAGWVGGLELEAWLATVNQVTVTDQGTSVVSDRVVPWWDVTVLSGAGPTSDSCEPTPCVRVLWSGSPTWLVAREGQPLRLYEIADPAGNLVVAVTSEPSGKSAWMDQIEGLLRTAELGPSLPHPLSVGTTAARRFIVPAGETWRFAGVDGLSLRVGEETVVVQRPGEVAVAPLGGQLQGMILDQSPAGATVGRIPALIGVITPHSSSQGEVVTSVEDIFTTIQSHTATWQQIGSEPILGHSAVVVDFDSGGNPLFYLRPPFEGLDRRQSTWPVHDHGRVWIFEGPAGPTALFITAETAELVQDTSRTNLTAVLSALELCAPGDSCDDGS